MHQRRLSTGVRSEDHRGDDHDPGRRRGLLQHGRLSDPGLRGDVPRHLPLRELHRTLRRHVRPCTTCRGGHGRSRVPEVRALQGTHAPRVRRAHPRPDPAGTAGHRDRPVVRGRPGVRPAGVQHGARPLAPGVAVQRLGEHQVGRRLLPPHGVQQRLGRLHRLPGPSRRRLPAPAAAPTGAGARERRGPRLLRDRPPGRPRRPLRLRRGTSDLPPPRRPRGRLSRPALVCGGRDPDRSASKRRGVPRLVPDPDRASHPLRFHSARRRHRRRPRPVSRARAPRLRAALGRAGGTDRPVRPAWRGARGDGTRWVPGRRARAARRAGARVLGHRAGSSRPPRHARVVLRSRRTRRVRPAGAHGPGLPGRPLRRGGVPHPDPPQDAAGPAEPVRPSRTRVLRGRHRRSRARCSSLRRGARRVRALAVRNAVPSARTAEHGRVRGRRARASRGDRRRSGATCPPWSR